jgi:hypothetical protein
MAFPLVEVAMMDPKQTRGFFNCNPGNMDRGRPPWNGELMLGDPRIVTLAPGQDEATRRKAATIRQFELEHGRFCVFCDAPHGVRAIVLNLRAYRDQLGCRTIRDYISRWAPPNENNTAGYIARVAASVSVDPDVPVDIHDRRIVRAIVEGIVSVECAGNPYANDNTIDEGLALAGVGA